MSYQSLESKIQQLIEKARNSSDISFGENLADPNEIMTNYYIGNGAEIAYTNWSITSYIPVDSSKVYSVTPIGLYNQIKYSGFYDENKQYLRQVSFTSDFTSTTKALVLKVPTNVRYVRFSATSADILNCGVYEVTDMSSSEISNTE